MELHTFVPLDLLGFEKHLEGLCVTFCTVYTYESLFYESRHDFPSLSVAGTSLWITCLMNCGLFEKEEVGFFLFL